MKNHATLFDRLRSWCMTLFGLALPLSLPHPCRAAERVACDEMSRKIQQHYNAGDYQAIHALLAPGFQQELSLTKCEQFFGTVMQPAYGKITTVTFASQRTASCTYRLDCEKGQGTLILTLSEDGDKIAGMLFKPGAPKVAGKADKAGAEPAHDNPLQTPEDQRVHKLVSEHYRKGHTPGLSIAVYEKGKATFYNYGEVSKGTGRKPTAASIYEIGSISKTFTSLLLAQAVEEKRIDLQADIRLILKGPYPNLVKEGEPVRWVHLANHTSGLPRLPADLFLQPDFNPAQPYQNYGWDKIAKFLSGCTLATVPGKTEEYSNLGPAILGHLLEVTLDESYAAQIQKRICDPLGMKDTSVEVTDSSRMVQGYTEEGDEAPAWKMKNWAPVGGIRSTTQDLMKYLVAHLQSETAAIRRVQEKTWGAGREAAALGWQLTALKNGENLVWHNGGTSGCSTFLGFVPKRGAGVIVLANSGESVDGLAVQLLK